MGEDQLSRDLITSLEHLKELKELLTRMYYSDEISALLKKSNLSVMQTAADFLTTNLTTMRQLWLKKA